MVNMIKTRRNYIIAITVLFVFVSLSGPTYSLFLKSDTTKEFNYNTGLLDLQFTEDEQLTLESIFPMLDSDALKGEPYKLTIKNTGTLIYLFDLKLLSTTSEDIIDSKYIKVKVNEKNPKTLYELDNVIYSDVILYPGEEKTFEINVWLDIQTPNAELGNKFTAKVVTSGTSIYKTLDTSGANHPILKDDMIPIYYDEATSNMIKADSSNTIATQKWYDYDSKKWANTVTIKNSKKQIYDVTRKNNISVDEEKLNINNGNLVIKEDYLELPLKYNDKFISNIVRIKFDKLTEEKSYIISNGKISYYYNNETNQFVFQNGTQTVTSKAFEIEEDKWYLLGYTYDGSQVNFYIDGINYGTSTLPGTISSNNTFKLGTNNTFKETSSIVIGDIYIYNDILTNEEINSNYRLSINIIYDNLVCGYNEFTPMTLKELYLSKPIGTVINNEDVEMNFVWIPRFKYKLWNVTGEKNIDSYNAYNNGIDIEFEKGNVSTGVIYCKNNICYNDELLITKVTKLDNGKYYTHPAFTNKEEQLTGLWVSKYEVSNKDNLESKKNKEVLTNENLTNLNNLIKNKNQNYHMIKNTEWGAISYLTHSKYGLCTNNKCTEIGTNKTNISGNDIKDSTTNNLYGVFDMGGSMAEFVTATYKTDNSVTNNNDYDLYYENTFILGDATRELSLVDGIWYKNTSTYIDSTNNWFIRGGILNREGSGVFYHNATTDTSNQYISTRIITK